MWSRWIGKTTVESLICPEILYKTKVVKNRLDYIVKICKGQISKERLLELINEKIEPNYGEKLNINGKYTVWTRDWSNLNQNMYNGLSFAEPLKMILCNNFRSRFSNFEWTGFRKT